MDSETKEWAPLGNEGPGVEQVKGPAPGPGSQGPRVQKYNKAQGFPQSPGVQKKLPGRLRALGVMGSLLEAKNRPQTLVY